MRVLIACECSGEIRRAFRALGHDAWSCDRKPSEDGSPYHIQGDCFEAAARGCPTDRMPWDLIIWHPPCTDLSVSGNAHAAAKIADGRRAKAAEFFMRCIRFKVARSCVENPIGVMSTKYREPDQIIQPHQFGHDASKATCFWLRALPPLMLTHVADDFFLPPPPAPRIVRGRPRYSNQTDSGQAMAEQWGALS